MGQYKLHNICTSHEWALSLPIPCIVSNATCKDTLSNGHDERYIFVKTAAASTVIMQFLPHMCKCTNYV